MEEIVAGVLAVLRPAAGAWGEEESARGPAPCTYLTLSVLRKGKSQTFTSKLTLLEL